MYRKEGGKMAKVSGLSGNYDGLQKNEAWQRIYEYGRNCIPVRENRIKRAYMRIFRPKTKVIRDGAVQKIKTEYIVPGDYVVVEEGQFVPVDGKILAQADFEVSNNLDGKEKEFVYQGAKVICGKAIIEAVNTSDATYTASLVKKIDGYNMKKDRFARKLKKWTIGVSIVSVLFAVFAFVFSMVNLQMGIVEKILNSLLSFLVMLLFCIPIGFISAFIASLSRQHKKLKESGLRVKRFFSLPEVEKVTMVCLDDAFLDGEYTRKISRLYEVGITIAVFTDKSIDEIADKVQKCGICNGEIEHITGAELGNLEEEDFRRVICENFVFCELDPNMKDRIILTFEEMGVKCLTTGDGLEGVIRIENADIGISKNHEKGSLDYELADATLYNNSFDALYEFIRQSFICSCSLKNYIYHMLFFQFPVILYILIMLINKINIGELWSLGVLLIFAVIPAAMFLIEKDYSISRLIDLKENKEKFSKRFIISVFVGVFILVAVLLIEELLVKRFTMDAYMSANIGLMIMAGIILVFSIVEKVKFPYKGKIALRNQKPPKVKVEKEQRTKDVTNMSLGKEIIQKDVADMSLGNEKVQKEESVKEKIAKKEKKVAKKSFSKKNEKLAEIPLGSMTKEQEKDSVQEKELRQEEKLKENELNKVQEEDKREDAAQGKKAKQDKIKEKPVKEKPAKKKKQDIANEML